MSAGWAKNEIDATKRRCDLQIVGENGQPAPPGIDFIGQGLVFLDGVGTPDYKTATGTITNKRRDLVIADFSTTATDTVNDRATKVGHGFETGDGPIVSNLSVGGILIATNYWLIRFDNDQFSFATSLANAYAGTKVDLTASINAAVFSDIPGTTQRAIWGDFQYEATQAETNHGGRETNVIVDGIAANVKVDGINIGSVGFRRRLFCGALTNVMMQEPASTAFDQLCEDGESYGAVIRLILACVFGIAGDYTNPPYTFKSLNGAKTRATINANSTGRTASTKGDLTP